MSRWTKLLFSAALIFAIGYCSPAIAQIGDDSGFGLREEFGDFGGGNIFGNQPAAQESPLELESFIVPGTNMKPALLVVRAKMATGWHVYSLTQKPGGPPKTEIALRQSQVFSFIEGEGFRAEEKPEVRIIEDAWPDLPVEEHYGRVTWVMPIKIADGVDPRTIEIQGELTKGQVCHDEDGCKPFAFMDTKFTAALGSDDQIAAFLPPAADATGDYVDVGRNITIFGRIEPATVAPGDTAKLLLTIQPQPGWHVYERDDVADGKAYRPTLLPLVTTSGLHALTPQADTEVISKEQAGDVIRYQDGVTTWTIDLPIPKDTEAGERKIEGYVGYVVCSDTQCLSPAGVQFRGTLRIGEAASEDHQPLAFTESSYGQASAALATSIAWSNKSEDPEFWAEVFGKFGFVKLESDNWARLVAPADPAQEAQPMWGMTFSRSQLIFVCIALCLLVSMGAGVILNVMPCVLPVIGLKIMSFAQQGGESRARVFMLNVWYSLGLLAVFLVIATFAAILHTLGQSLAWGEHLGDPRFAVPLLAIVFVLGLSMFGVWEIPIPGFAGSGAASEMANKEGPLGAFFKGVLTTILATPCGGPLIGLAVGIAVIAPIWLTYTMFTCMGLGMALPYLVIGAFPKLVSKLPKPGPWMDGFKQFMGFVLMLTGVWIISFLSEAYVIASLAMMVGFGIVCWIVGRTPLTATGSQKMKRYFVSAVVSALSVLAFVWMLPSSQWEAFSRATLDQRINQGHTVLVDFTADW